MSGEDSLRSRCHSPHGNGSDVGVCRELTNGLKVPEAARCFMNNSLKGRGFSRAAQSQREYGL
jgi:hypothetical protein